MRPVSTTTWWCVAGDRSCPAQVLNGIESRELPLLSWGVSDGSLTEPELEQLIQQLAPGRDVDTVIDALLDRGLLFASGVTEQRFRTRMAETVRLAARLRQWLHGRPWTSAAESGVGRSVPQSSPDGPSDATSTPTHSARDCDRAAWSGRIATKPSWFAPRHARGFGVPSARADSSVSDRCWAARNGHRRRHRIRKDLGVLPSGADSIGRDTSPEWSPTDHRDLSAHRIAPRSVAQPSHHLPLPRGFVPNVGVLYGAVPNNRADAEHSPYTAWKKVPDGLVCPIIDCLEDGCGGRLIWPRFSRNERTTGL